MTLIAITGPTAVGKSALCLDVAERFGVPVINCDSRQMFRELPIGTAAPTPEEMRRVRHYFVGNLSLQDYYSASRYEEDVISLLTELSLKDLQDPKYPKNPKNPRNPKDPKNPKSPIAILSGGSMMYMDAVCNGIDDIPTVSPEVREMILQRYEQEGLDTLRTELRLRDPEYYGIVDLKNPKRIMHALEICYQSGRTYTSFRTNQKKQRPFKILKIALDRPREELYARINGRVLQMMADGLEEEARKVYPYRGLNSLNTVGYKEMFQYFDGQLTKDEAIERIQANTRKYARKQLTWLRRDKSVRWFHPEQKEEIIRFIEDTIREDTLFL